MCVTHIRQHFNVVRTIWLATGHIATQSAITETGDLRDNAYLPKIDYD